MITYRPSADQGNLPATTGSGVVSNLSAPIFRAQLESDIAKHVRWWTETSLGPRIVGNATRNTLMN